MLTFDYFAGGGGASCGIEAATGRSPDVAINHDEAAIAMHAINHPKTAHHRTDVWDVDPVRDLVGGPVGLLWLSPDCFPAGTMILTRRGYRAIERVQVGEEVLTHERRWRAVTATMTSVRPLQRLRGHGHPGLLVSAEHPFLVRRRTDVWSKTKGRSERVLAEAGWVPAGELSRGVYWASPFEFPADSPPAVPVFKRRATEITPEIMWLAGRYIADGWTRLTKTRAELVITCGHHETDGLRSVLAKWPRSGARAASDEMSWCERDTATAHQFAMNHRGLVTWLREHFGHGAPEKLIPGWALGMREDLRAALLAGYLSGDGHRGERQGSPLVEAHTVSRALAFGIKALAATLGHAASVYLDESPTSVIEGRRVKARPSWSVRWRDPVAPSHRQTERDGGMFWAPIREATATGTEAQVFNLSVDEDESYVADGIVVHNCRHFSRAKGAVPVSKRVRGLAWIALRLAAKRRPALIVLENVPEFRTWGPLNRARNPLRPKAGHTFERFTAQLRDLGYQLEHRVLDAADYGAPTHRRRLVLIARCDGEPIVWPAPTHGPGRTPYRTAAECIDWSLPCPSIFGRSRPLAEATMKRIAEGVRRYVLNAPRPFIVQVNHGRDINRSRELDRPMPTVTQKHGFGLVAPTLVQTGYGERKGQRPRALDLHEPLGTVVACGAKHALVAAFLAKHYGGVVGHGVERPLGTVTSRDHHSIVACHLSKFYGTSTGSSLDEPAPTVSAQGHHPPLAAPFLDR